MTCDYEAIRSENIKRYGTHIGRIGRMLLTDRYDERTHFIFELLQNAEDALARRAGWQGPRAVLFDLKETGLRVSHYGDPFDQADVRGICGIAESTKDLNEIGRFGIGFKSVYAFTDRPEIHSGSQDFAIEKFVWPIAVPAIDRDEDETVIQIPFKPDDNSAQGEIAAGLRRLGIYGLLFLSDIGEISWRVEGGASGQYLRESTDVDFNVRRVTIVGKEGGKSEIDEEWLVFSRLVDTDDGSQTKPVEIAFSCVQDKESNSQRIRRIERSPLVVFFPTAVETHLGFLIQGPYRTTPSRDNIPKDDDWNRRLVGETSALLRETLCWLRDHHLLDTEALRCLPLDSTKFDNTNMFSPIFEATKQTLSSKPLLPRFDAGYVPAKRARLGRTQALRNLFSPAQLTALYQKVQELAWLSDDITLDRAPDLRDYLMKELNVEEIDPEDIIRQLNRAFLETQPDEWILKLYEFLKGLPSLRHWRWFADLPLIRLEDGSHVAVKAGGKLAAFLPTKTITGFPTVRRSVCTTEPAGAFLESLGLKEPDPVDDVIENVLPTYQTDEIDISDGKYEDDIQRILSAFGTDSETQRKRLINELKKTAFVKTVDAGDRSESYARPSKLYLATERLKDLLNGITGVLFVDDSCLCLRGENIRELLERCDAVRYLRPISGNTLSYKKRSKLREKAGHPETSRQNDHVADWTLEGLEELFAVLPNLDIKRQGKVASLLWKELAHLEERRGKRLFTGNYTWTHYGSYKQTFKAAFVRRLNATRWVPDADGKLQCPKFVLFDSLGWNEHPFLQSEISFKPPIIETLAREAGFEPGMLDLLNKLGVTSEAELRDRLGLEDKSTEEATGNLDEISDPVDDETNESEDRDGADKGGAGSGRGKNAENPTSTSGSVQGKKNTENLTSTSGNGQGERGDKGLNTAEQEQGPEVKSSRQFISYVAVHSDEEEPNPGGINHQERMALEAKAIDLILEREPDWQRTPTHNPGYDLYKIHGDDGQNHYCEVKAMSGSLEDRPVGLSHTQFKWACDHGENYWLYVVEHAGAEGAARIVKIQDPAGKARTFTFDHGWLNVAIMDTDSEGQEA